MQYGCLHKEYNRILCWAMTWNILKDNAFAHSLSLYIEFLRSSFNHHFEHEYMRSFTRLKCDSNKQAAT